MGDHPLFESLFSLCMPDILLITLNARYNHASLGLRYLYANLAALQTRTELLELTIAMRPLDMAEQILAKRPKIVGLGVYIWNVQETTSLVSLLKVLDPSLKIILGGARS